MCSIKVLCAVVHPILSQHELASGVMSCSSKANLQVTVGGGIARTLQAPCQNHCILRWQDANCPVRHRRPWKTMGTIASINVIGKGPRNPSVRMAAKTARRVQLEAACGGFSFALNAQ